MKVFISWSGSKSHKVAMVFRNWLPSVIQSIEPYVSSEDIDKGARWSTDIAQELENSTFGILCVTKENLNAPWLSFEAGALSKTMDKSLVTPFLYDIKRSEVKGPILQFQSTIFQNEDIKKLIKTLNKASGDNMIADSRLDKAFDVWYPTLEQELNKLKGIKDEDEDSRKQGKSKNQTSEILEEILDLSRNNQKLLRSPDSKMTESLDEIKRIMQDYQFRNEKEWNIDLRRFSRKIHPMLLEEMLHLRNKKSHVGLLISLSLFKNEFPWVYDLGKELIEVLKSKKSRQIKHTAVQDFKDVLEFTLGHPMVREMYGNRKDSLIYFKEYPLILIGYLERFI